MAPAVAPEAVEVKFVPVPPADLEALRTAVGDELAWLLEDEGRSTDQVAVLTFHRAVRDALHEELDLVRWEDRSEAKVLGENVHRVKGLESDTVILATDREEPDALLYVGISRAVNELIVVGPPAVGERLGLG
jgi:hypothetical protein